MTLSRTPLRASKEHEVELTDTSGTWGQYRCTRCGDSRSELIPKVESGERDPLPWPCTGLKRGSGLQRNKRVNPVSDRREEKRASRGVRGALCDDVRGTRCAVDGCYGRSDPAHLDSVNSGGADFTREDGRWIGRVAPLCRDHHRTYDGDIGGGSGEHFEAEHDLDLDDVAFVTGEVWMKRHGVDPEDERHPYEQLEEAA